MISLIICSRTSNISRELETNIKETVGTDYETIIIDNSKNEYSIFTAYNEGVRRSKGNLLCFMHEDILFHTGQWGRKIYNHFEDKTIGVIGFAGTHYLPSTPIYWYSSTFISEYSYQTGKKECFHTDFFNGLISDVISVDGFCMFIRKSLFEQIKFDDKTFKGFHLYDMDICMQILDIGYNVCVCKDILIEHFWVENPSKKGMELFEHNIELFYNKWQHQLPLAIGLEKIPSCVLDRINNLYKLAWDAKIARRSRAYKLGKFILSPFKIFKSK